jgi:hypothetical protein
MTKLSWAIAMALVVANVAFLVASSGIRDVKGAGCNNNQCYTLVFSFIECYHKNDYQNGDPCHPDGCIMTSVFRSACLIDSESDSSCEKEYDAQSVRVYQILRESGNCSSDSTVTWHYNTQAGDSCTPSYNYQTACESGSCVGDILHEASRLGRDVCAN